MMQCVTNRMLADGAVQARHLSDRSVQSGHLDDGAVTTRGMADAAVDARVLANQAVTPAHLSDQAKAVFGIDQTLQDVKGVRAVGSTYYNTTGQPICVMLALLIPAGAIFNAFYINEKMVAEAGLGGTTAIRQSLTVMVPPGASYSFAALGQPLTIEAWYEIR